MTGRPGYRTMELIGGSSAPYLARTPCVPLFCTSFNRVGNKERFRLPGAGGGSFPLYGGTFARSYSVSNINSIADMFQQNQLCSWLATAHSPLHPSTFIDVELFCSKLYHVMSKSPCLMCRQSLTVFYRLRALENPSEASPEDQTWANAPCSALKNFTAPCKIVQLF